MFMLAAFVAAITLAPVPGVIDPAQTMATLCVPGYATAARVAAGRVSTDKANRIYKRDGRTRVKGVCCEVDHLISLELGGTNDLANLWTQPWAEAKAKDQLEDTLYRQMCAGIISLSEAQRDVRNSKRWRPAAPVTQGTK
jgi:hypothetical protein